MAHIVIKKEWTESVNKASEMEAKLQQKENDVNTQMEKRKSDDSDEQSMGNKSQEEVFTWEIQTVTDDTSVFNATSPLYSLKCFPIGFKVKLSLTNNYYRDGDLSLQLYFELSENAEALSAKMPFNPTVTFTVCDACSENEYKRDIIRSVEQPFGTQIITYNKACYETEIDSNCLETARCISVEGKLTLKIGVSFDYPRPREDIVRWKVDHYMLKRLMCNKGLVDFYPVKCIETHDKGYRVRVKLHFGVTFAISVQFLTGEFDEQLKRVFAHVTTVVVENQWDPSAGKHLVKTVVKQDNVTKYKLEMANHQELESGGYLVDDTLQLKLIIVAI